VNAAYPGNVSTAQDIDLPSGSTDKRELLLSWLNYLRGAGLRKVEGLDDAQGRWTPEGHLISLLGIVNHLAHVEWRWIDGGMLGEKVSRSEDEFSPSAELTVVAAVAAYPARAAATNAAVRAMRSLAEPCRREEGTDLRWVLLHLINETARHAGHAGMRPPWSIPSPRSPSSASAPRTTSQVYRSARRLPCARSRPARLSTPVDAPKSAVQR
jgi:uncharacterized damage-inducible protein DinB